ncbi:unnamed protein product [Arctia plantaginis]|uniref:Uncharacterized protein n=1 Tax=Arctia plantaginis TaxID=874455 RepID=A0A8S0ZIR4_ARCPL|nr:unnamed protein product [Arctia plantaginis]
MPIGIQPNGLALAVSYREGSEAASEEDSDSSERTISSTRGGAQRRAGARQGRGRSSVPRHSSLVEPVTAIACAPAL